MNSLSEEIIESLQRRNIHVTVRGTDNPNLVLSGRICNLTDDDRKQLRSHKAEIIRYVSGMPSCSSALYIAPDMEFWITDVPQYWAAKVTISGKPFVRLTPEVIGWLKEQILNAERECDTGRLPVAEFARMIRAHDPRLLPGL